jgi:hypothetical protein
MGQVLSELDRDSPDRVARHAQRLAEAASRLMPGGALVVVEPALRDRTRHLHAVRDAVLAGSSGLHVFAPCVHDAPCPMLPDPDAWCHEDLDVDLPPWLVPVARAAGLRWQGLTFSYLVLQREPPARDTRRLRVVSAPVVTKGKRELFLCGPLPGRPDAVRAKVMRLDRHRSPSNAAWDDAARGDLLVLDPAPTADRRRVEATTSVELASAASASEREDG